LIKVLLFEDAHMVRGALVALLGFEPNIEVVAEVASGDDILPAARKHRADVAVLDIDLPGKDGLTAATEIHEHLPDCRTLILTSLGRPGTIRRALMNRVDGFMLKDAPSDKVANAIRDVAAGQRVVDNQLALTAWDTTDCPLTNREVDIFTPGRGWPQRCGHRSGAVSVPRYGSQLSHLCGDQAEREEPGGRDQDRAGGRMVVNRPGQRGGNGTVARNR
jgi:two-component system, NarL family, response regulator DesR